MRKSKQALAMAGLVAAAGLAAPAAAQDAGLYLGGSVGKAEFQHTCGGYTGTCDAKDTGYRVFGGYQFNPNLALELGYANLDNVFVDGTRVGSAVPVSFERRVKAGDFSAVFSLPFSERLALVGRLGVYRSQVEILGSEGGAAINTSEHNTSWTFGAGVALEVAPKLSLRAEFQRYDSVGGSRTGEDDIDFLSVGFVARF